jgi:hypothetical protein
MKSPSTKARSAGAPQPVQQATKKTAAKDDSMQIVESGSCPSLTGRSTLRYEVAKDRDSALHLRIVSNSGHGKFHRKFVPLAPLMSSLERAKGAITSGTLRSVCRGMSVNQGGFLLSVFLGKGLVERLPGKERGYALSKAFPSGGKPLAKPAASDASAKPWKGKPSSKSKTK